MLAQVFESQVLAVVPAKAVPIATGDYHYAAAGRPAVRLQHEITMVVEQFVQMPQLRMRIDGPEQLRRRHADAPAKFVHAALIVNNGK